MKKIKDRDIRNFEIFSLVVAVLTTVLCTLFLLNLMQYRWFLNFILGLGVLLHFSLFLLNTVKKKAVMEVLSAGLGVFYIACLVYFNVT